MTDDMHGSEFKYIFVKMFNTESEKLEKIMDFPSGSSFPSFGMM